MSAAPHALPRVGFVTLADAGDPRSWSGTVFHMSRALAEAGAALDHIGPLDVRELRRDKLVNRTRRRLGMKTTKPLRSWRAARAFSRQITEALAGLSPDILFTPAGAVVLADLKTDLPVAYSSDATLDLMRTYYAPYLRLSRGTLRQLEELEQASIARADLLIYPTEWVARSAIEHYGADPARVHIVPYGANLDAPPREAALAARPDGPLRLLFVGVDWVRKGGDIAVAALSELNRRGVDAEMTVIGCTPPEHVPRDRLTVIPFLDKNDPGQRQELSRHYLGADLFLLPTRQECYGVVFCEAAAHGVPVIATATGGVPGVVTEGVTGHLLPEEADGTAYADAIEHALAAPGGPEALRKSARDDYEVRLNWQAWAGKALSLMEETVAGRRRKT